MLLAALRLWRNYVEIPASTCYLIHAMAKLFKQKGSRNWWISYHASGRRFRKTTGTADKKLAEKALVQIQAQIDASRHGLDAPPLGIKEFIELYRAKLVSADCSPSVIKQDTRRLTRFFEIVQRPPARVVSRNILDWESKRRQEVSPHTVKRDWDTLAAAFTYALNLGFLPESPFTGLNKPRIKRQKHIRSLSDTEVERLLACASNYRNGLLLAPIGVAVFAGLRQGEIRHLDWSDIDFQQRTLSVTIKPEWRPKDYEERVIPLHSRLAGTLLPLAGSGPCFSGGPDRRRGKTFFTVNLRHLRKIAELDCDWNVLRHTFASGLVRRGVSIFKVSKLLGHSSVRTTEKHYAHLAPNTLLDDIEKLGW